MVARISWMAYPLLLSLSKGTDLTGYLGWSTKCFRPSLMKSELRLEWTVYENEKNSPIPFLSICSVISSPVASWGLKRLTCLAPLPRWEVSRSW